MALEVERVASALTSTVLVEPSADRGGPAGESELLEAVVAQMPVGVVVRDAAGRLMATNARLREIWRGNGLPRTIPEFADWPSYHPDGTPYAPEDWPIARSLRTGEIVQDEPIEIDRFDGSRSTISVSSVPIRNPVGLIIAAVAVVNDISEQTRVAEAREAFLGVLAHELRTPITSIFGGSILLEKAAGSGTILAELAADVAAESERLRRMVDDLVVVSRLERGAELRRDEPVLVHRVIDRVLREEATRRPEHLIEADVPLGLPPIMGVDGYLEQILRNLISNAAKYGGPEGTIRVVGRSEGQTVTVSVQDEGPGFDDGDEERVFTLFYRGAAASRRAAGAGIGLYVVGALAAAMSGEGWARTRPGGGGEVGVTLQVAEPTA